MDLKRNSRPKPWISKKRGRNRRGLESGILIRPFEGVASNGFYKTSQWRATREAVLSRDAICQWCLHLGQLNPATDADHVVPLNRCENEGVSGYDQTNIVGSCRSCISRRALANDFECQIDVTWGVDSRMDIMVETDDERVVYLIMEEGLS